MKGAVRCPSAALLHRPCPACGSTRAVLALVHGDLVEMLRTNPIAPFATAFGLVLLAIYAHAVYVDGSGRGAMDTPRARFVAKLLVYAVVAQFVIWTLRSFGMLGGPVEVNG